MTKKLENVSGVSREPISPQAIQVMKSENCEFVKEYWDLMKGKRIVKTRYPSKHGNGRHGKVLVVWSFDPKGELMRKQAQQRRAVREPLFPRGKHARFPRFRLFPRYSKKWEKKLGLRK